MNPHMNQWRCSKAATQATVLINLILQLTTQPAQDARTQSQSCTLAAQPHMYCSLLPFHITTTGGAPHSLPGAKPHCVVVLHASGPNSQHCPVVVTLVPKQWHPYICAACSPSYLCKSQRAAPAGAAPRLHSTPQLAALPFDASWHLLGSLVVKASSAQAQVPCDLH